MELYPSILVDDYQEFEKRIKFIQGVAPLLHIDVGDGIFVPHKSFGDIGKIKQFPFACAFELHLMITNPVEAIASWLETSARRFIVHWEALKDEATLNSFVAKIKQQSKEVGLALNPQTPVDEILFSLHALDLVLIMGVEPGFSGQPFIPEVAKKITRLKEVDFKGIIEVDGGMNETRIKEVKAAGASAVALASAIFDQPDPPAALLAFRKEL